MDRIGMTLEIELGCTGGEEDGVDNSHLDSNTFYTQPEHVNLAYEKLRKISHRFIIAASFGNVHGVYKPGNIVLTPKILKESQSYVSKKHNLPYNSLDFVFHGGSGSSSQEIKESIDYGVVKMNIDTDAQWATWQGILNYYKKNQDFLQNQLGNSQGKNQPNKKYYDPRVWLRNGQVNLVKHLENVFKKLNAVNVL
jgi:fructose-bisphosphate aldolase class II